MLEQERLSESLYKVGQAEKKKVKREKGRSNKGEENSL